ncbi:MAG: hypothetical protein ABIQ40_12330 [Bacteroidia bacterium]
MKKFLFITHITPVNKRSALRQALIDAYYKGLAAQTYGQWKVVVVGEENKTEGKFHYFNLPGESREEKAVAVKAMMSSERFLALANEADYIVKLDDDDIISPGVLEKVSAMDVDAYYDRFHTFYDISSGVITQQRRDWFASTCIHKREHVLAEWNGSGATAVGNLLYTEHHASWHVFYKDKNAVAADPAEPVYMRVLSPTSITSGALAGPPQSISEISMDKYFNYLKSFGNWNPAPVKNFTSAFPALATAWLKFSGHPQQSLPENVTAASKEKIISKIKNIFFGKRNR